MTDPALTPAPVFRLIYGSHSLIAPDDRRSALGEIFTAARRNNRRLDVTGALLISDRGFVQALEGEEPVVRELYESIARDTRHEQLNVLEERTVTARVFSRWAMAKVATDDGSDIRLFSNARRAVIVSAKAADQSITPGQEAVLAFMRETPALRATV